jgi:hypothetical protein
MDCQKMPNVKNIKDCSFANRMDDSRAFTDYRANDAVTSAIRYKEGIVTGADYREYLTKNAVKLMNINSQEAWGRVGCKPCKNLCLGIDQTEREGNSTHFAENSCIPPADFYKYVGTDGVHYPMLEPNFTRSAVPSGFDFKNMS